MHIGVDRGMPWPRLGLLVNKGHGSRGSACADLPLAVVCHGVSFILGCLVDEDDSGVRNSGVLLLTVLAVDVTPFRWQMVAAGSGIIVGIILDTYGEFKLPCRADARVAVLHP